MPAFHLILHDEASAVPRRLDFVAAGPEQAFQFARNETPGIAVELWRANTLITRMTKAADNLWLLHGSEQAASDRGTAPTRRLAHDPLILV